MKILFGIVMITAVLSSCGNSDSSPQSVPPMDTSGTNDALIHYDQEIGKTWKLMNRTREDAHNAREFGSLRNKYPLSLNKFDAGQVEYARVNLSTYRYIGATKCDAHSSRLSFVSFFYEVCLKGQSDKKCQLSPMTIPSDHDPCDRRRHTFMGKE